MAIILALFLVAVGYCLVQARSFDKVLAELSQLSILSRRNREVYLYLLHLNHLTVCAGFYDFASGKDPSWRVERYREVLKLQDLMVLQFWKPLDSFISDKSFAEIQK